MFTQQIRQALENHIRSESIAPGEALPTLMEISGAASVSIRTAQKALQELLDEGICHRSGSRKLILGKLPAQSIPTEKRKVIIVCHQLGEKSVPFSGATDIEKQTGFELCYSET